MFVLSSHGWGYWRPAMMGVFRWCFVAFAVVWYWKDWCSGFSVRPGEQEFISVEMVTVVSSGHQGCIYQPGTF